MPTIFQFSNRHTLTLDNVRDFLSQGYTDAYGKWWQLCCERQRERSRAEVRELLEQIPNVIMPPKITPTSLPIMVGGRYRLDFLYFYQLRMDEYLDAIQSDGVICSIKRDIVELSYNGKAFMVWWSLCETSKKRTKFATKEDVREFNKNKTIQYTGEIITTFKNSPFAVKNKYSDSHRFTQYKRDHERKYIQNGHK